LTDPPPAGQSTGLFKHLDRITENRWLKTLVAIGEVVGLFVLLGSGVSWLVRQVGDDDPSAAATAAPSVVAPSGDGPTTAPSVPSSSGPRSTEPADEQLCFSSTNTVVDCRETHRFEALPTFGACDQRMVIDYVGGRAALDVTIAKALKIPGGKCWLAADRDVTGTAKDVLQGPDSANWRRCYDRRIGTNVSCGVLPLHHRRPRQPPADHVGPRPRLPAGAHLLAVGGLLPVPK
jgi:hypothetical protein